MKLFLPNLCRSTRLVLLVSISLLSACAYLPETSTVQPSDWEHRLEQKRTLENWKVTGRLGVQTADNGGSFDIHWRQRGDRYEIRLIAPLGQGMLLIKGDAARAELYEGRSGKRVVEPSQVFERALGLRLSVDALKSWVTGIPSRDLRVSELRWDQRGDLSVIRQSGWQVELSDYRVSLDDRLPHSVLIQHDSDEALQVRLLVRDRVL